MKSNKKNLIEVIVFSILILLVNLLFYKPNKELSKFIADNPTSIFVFNDNQNNGLSNIDTFNIENGNIFAKLHIKKNKNIEYPYCGIGISFNKLGFLNLTDYDFLTFSFKTLKGYKYKINIGTYDSSKIIRNSPLKSVYNEAIFTSHNKAQKVRLKLSDLYIPSWWYEATQANKQNIKADFSKTTFIQFENAQFPQDSTQIIKDEIQIKDITFSSKNTKYKILLISLLILFILYKLFVLLIYPKLKNKSLNIDEIDKKILEYVANNYYNSQISLEMIVESEQLKDYSLNKQRVSYLFNNKLQIGFKQYINELRIKEAKRLLDTSNLSIADICYNVGYNNLVHFNRVFKQFYSISPSDYRNKKNEN